MTGPGQRKKRTLKVPIILLALAAFFFDGQNRLVSTTYTVPIAGLPESFEGYRIVQLSDLHGRSFGRGNRRLLARIRAEEPDLIAVTGDLTEKRSDLAVTEKLLPELRKLAPCCYVSGNHEFGSGTMRELAVQLSDSGIENLCNRSLYLERGGEKLLLCGVEDPNSYADLAAPDAFIASVRETHPDEPIVLLAHRNDIAELYPVLDVDLILCGHAHGGVIRIPGVGGLISASPELFPAYSEGCIDLGRYRLVISRGLGNARRIPRLFNNPELVTVILRAG